MSHHYLFLAALPLFLLAGSAQCQVSPLAADTARARQATPASCPTVIGVITGPESRPLVGATVMVKGNLLAVYTTNSEGQFVVKGPLATGTVLLISASGYKGQEVTMTGCNIPETSLELLPGTKLKANGRIKRTAASGRIRKWH